MNRQCFDKCLFFKLCIYDNLSQIVIAFSDFIFSLSRIPAMFSFLLYTFLACLAIFLYKNLFFMFTMIRADIHLQQYPQQNGLPIIRNLLDYIYVRDILPNAYKAMRTYGGVVAMCGLVGSVNLQITDQKILEYLLGTTNILNKGLLYKFMENWLGSGLLTAKSEKWRKTRKMLTPAFHFQILEHYVEVFHSSSLILIDKLRKKCNINFDVTEDITLCTLDMICETAMGTKVNAQLDGNSSYVRAVREMCRIIMDRYFNVLKVLMFVLSKDYFKEKKALKILHDYTNSVIKQRRQEMVNSKDKVEKKKRLAFLDLLLKSEIDGRPLTDTEIREEVDTFMFEGHDTTASAICFTLHCLSKHQDVQDKVFDELADILGEDKLSAPTMQDLQNMKYLEMVLKESMRLYPPVPVFTRSPEKDVEYFGGSFPRGGQLAVFPFGVHRDPKNFPDPERFDPERFTAENQSTRSPYSYLAFSAGPRNCIGQRFAMLEMKSTLSYILRNFQILPVDGFEPVLIPLTVLKSANGIHIRLRERV